MAAAGWRVVYLGGDLPASDIAAAARHTGARAVAVSLVYITDRNHTLAELRTLRNALPATTAIVAGGAASGPLEDELGAIGVSFADSFDDMRAALSGIGT